MQLMLLKFEHDNKFDEFRTIEIDGELWFVANDVCNILGYKYPKDTVRQRCKPKGARKHRLLTEGGYQMVTLINEPNMYRLIAGSKLPEAERFEEWLFEEVLPSIRKKGFYGVIDRTKLPNFIKRFQMNWSRVDKGYFSVISELYVRLYSSLERVGYVIPDKAADGKEIRPDVSVGRLFSPYLHQHYPHLANKHKPYMHVFPNGTAYPCRQYENEVLPAFIKFVEDVWIPQKAEAYLGKRDRMALEYLPKLLQSSDDKAA